MLDIIRAIRLPECILVVLVGYLGFVSSGLQPSLSVLAALFLVIASTMLQNDWRDRFHDIGKGKWFASSRPHLFLALLILVWIGCVSLVVFVSFHHMVVGLLLGVMACVGAVYSEARRIPLASVFIVTIVSASPFLLPLGLGVSSSVVLPLYAAAALILFGRETLHDIADADVDRGYKKTISLVFGDKAARMAAAIGLLAGCAILSTVSLLTLVGSGFILWGLVALPRDAKVVTVRRRVDVGLVLLLIALFVNVSRL